MADWDNLMIGDNPWHKFLRAPEGTIVRFDSFFISDNHQLHDVWGVMCSPRRGGAWRDVELFTGDVRGMRQTDTSDRALVVYPSKVPDHIWAALAKWRLIGADASR